MGLLWNCILKTLSIYDNKLCLGFPVRKTSHLPQISLVLLSMPDPVPTRKDLVKSGISECQLWFVLSKPTVNRIIAKTITPTFNNKMVQISTHF